MGSAWSADVYASLTCPICGKKFSNRTSLADHKAFHEGRTFCSICNKLCSTLANLRRHEKTHSGVVEGGYTRGQIIAQNFLSQENQEG